MNPTDGEQALYDHDAVADLQWAGNDIEGAKALLDEAGIVDSDGDGWREWNGEKISLNAVCPNGWTDWQASMEVLPLPVRTLALRSPLCIPSTPSIRPCLSIPTRLSMPSSCGLPMLPLPPIPGAV